MAGQPLGQISMQVGAAAASYNCSAGICQGSTSETVGVFAGLQRMVNVMLALYKQGVEIRVDGVLGPETLRATGLVLSLAGRQAAPDVAWLAANAERLTDELAAVAKVTPNRAPPSAAAASTALVPAEGERLPDPLPDSNDQGSKWGWWVLGGMLLTAAGAIGWYMLQARGSSMKSTAGAEDYGYEEAIDDFIDV